MKYRLIIKSYIRWALTILLIFRLNCIYGRSLRLDTTGRSEEEQCKCSAMSFSSDLDTGTFKSPRFPEHYCNSLECVYEIEPKSGLAVILIVDHFDTEARHDFCEVYHTVKWPENVDNPGFQEIKHYVLSGTSILQRYFFSSVGGGFKLVFKTDKSNSEHSGFQMSFHRFAAGVRRLMRHAPCPAPFHMAEDDMEELPALTTSFRVDSSCVFQINSTEAIRLKIKHLDARLKLKVYETNDFIAKSVVTPIYSLNGFTPLNEPRILTSRTSSLTLIIFFTAVLDGSQHYQIEYEKAPSVCACPPSSLLIASSEPKSFISPGYPVEYCDNLNCTTVVGISEPAARLTGKTKTNSVIRVKFEDAFMLEMDVDYLEFHDPETFDFLIDLIGEQRPLVAFTEDARGIRYLTFDQNQMIAHFVTDHSVTETGFNLTMEVYEKTPECMCPGLPLTRNDKKGNLTTILPEKCQFMDCFWELQIPPVPANSSTFFRVIMKVEFAVYDSTEFIEITHGSNNIKNSDRTKLDAEMLPDDEDQSLQKSIDVEDIEFVSIWYHREGDKTSGARKLRIEYEWREKCYCGENELKAELGVWKPLTSPDYPLQYCNNLNCEYRIVADEGLQIAINITDFFTEMNQDNLAIFEGNTTDKEHLQLVSGVELFVPIIRTESNMMTLLFTTDMSITMRGFSLMYTAEKTPAYRDTISKSTGYSRWSIACVVILVVILGSTAVAFLFIRSNRLNVANDRGGPAIRFVRGLRTESQFSLINPVFQTLGHTRQDSHETT